MREQSSRDTSFRSRQCTGCLDRLMFWLGSLAKPDERQSRVHGRLMARERRRIQAKWTPMVERIRATGLNEQEYRESIAVYPMAFGRGDICFDEQSEE